MELNTLFDRTDTIRESVTDVKFTLLLTIALVVLVIFLFLRNLSATVIPSLALPLSIIGTFAAMYALGFSVNNITLMALTLSVGFVVDDAIVMLENIVRHMEHGESAMEASLRGSKEIGFTIISMTISLVAVFIPVLFMAGMLGRMLHEFAVTITFGHPDLRGRFPDPDPHALQPFPQAAWPSSGTAACTTSWSVSSTACCRPVRTHPHPGAALPAHDRGGHLPDDDRHGLALHPMPMGLLPADDIGAIFAITEGAQGVSFEEMKAPAGQAG